MDASGNPEAFFRKNSRSFSLAARLFDPRDRLEVARIYRFCRYLDDLADDTLAGDTSALDRVWHTLAQPLTALANSIEADFLALAAARNMPLAPAFALIEALREDCGARSVQSPEELLRFAYGVAGTVGQMMRYVIGAHEARADAFAIDLGIGMQLTNVVRDIAEDAARDRFYLPAEWVEPDEIKSALRGDARAILLVQDAVCRTLRVSDRYYESARRGFVYIPTRNRRVIFLAAALYQAIGRKILRSGAQGWLRRTVLGKGEKLAVVLRALWEFRARLHGDWTREAAPTHDPMLHSALGDLVSLQGRIKA